MSYAQVKKHFLVESSNECKKIVLNYSSSSGTCYLAPGANPDAVSVYSNRDIDNYNHSFDRNLENGINSVVVKLKDKNHETFSQSISSRMFTDVKSDEDLWKVYLSENVPYNLNLKYGIGDAFIDLSGLSVERLKVNTSSANINVAYLSGVPNQIVMDTLSLKVDLGSLEANQINLSKANTILADVGFGNALLDFTSDIYSPTFIRASVGAGNLIVSIPKESTPVIIRIRSSLLCNVKLSKSFHEIADNVYVNETYDANAQDLLSFNVDVSMGSIVFRENK